VILQAGGLGVTVTGAAKNAVGLAVDTAEDVHAALLKLGLLLLLCLRGG
jgi:hypothetical protein